MGNPESFSGNSNPLGVNADNAEEWKQFAKQNQGADDIYIPKPETKEPKPMTEDRRRASWDLLEDRQRRGELSQEEVAEKKREILREYNEWKKGENLGVSYNPLNVNDSNSEEFRRYARMNGADDVYIPDSKPNAAKSQPIEPTIEPTIEPINEPAVKLRLEPESESEPELIFSPDIKKLIDTLQEQNRILQEQIRVLQEQNKTLQEQNRAFQERIRALEEQNEPTTEAEPRPNEHETQDNQEFITPEKEKVYAENIAESKAMVEREKQTQIDKFYAYFEDPQYPAPVPFDIDHPDLFFEPICSYQAIDPVKSQKIEEWWRLLDSKVQNEIRVYFTKNQPSILKYPSTLAKWLKDNNQLELGDDSQEAA